MVSRQRLSQLRFPAKNAARRQLYAAVKAGKVTRPDACSRCGSGGRIHGHHPDYNQGLVVVWVCTSCHADIHRGEARTVAPRPVREQAATISLSVATRERLAALKQGVGDTYDSVLRRLVTEYKERQRKGQEATAAAE